MLAGATALGFQGDFRDMTDEQYKILIEEIRGVRRWLKVIAFTLVLSAVVGLILAYLELGQLGLIATNLQ
jgi:hypothetical protein